MPGQWSAVCERESIMNMLGKVVMDKTNVPAVMKSLDANMLRARVISNNIANVNTPGYARLDVSFENHLQAALDKTRLRGTTTNEKHIEMGRKDISGVDAQVERPYDPTLPSGVNNVDIDVEMAKLAEAQILYNYGVKFVKGSYDKINSAIQGKSVQ